MKILRYLVLIIVHPRRTSREIVQGNSIYPALAVVVGYGLVLSVLFLRSHFLADYPPPADELKVWIDTWGEFAMLPFVKVPAESYRLAQAFIMVPFTLAVWILMAGSARILSNLFGGQASFDQYLSVFGFSFFAFWILGQLLEMAYSLCLGRWIVPALRSEYGPAVRLFFAYYPSVMWTILPSLGGVYNGLVTYEIERFAPWKAVITALVTLAWPLALITVTLR